MMSTFFIWMNKNLPVFGCFYIPLPVYILGALRLLLPLLGSEKVKVIRKHEMCCTAFMALKLSKNVMISYFITKLKYFFVHIFFGAFLNKLYSRRKVNEYPLAGLDIQRLFCKWMWNIISFPFKVMKPKCTWQLDLEMIDYKIFFLCEVQSYPNNPVFSWRCSLPAPFGPWQREQIGDGLGWSQGKTGPWNFSYIRWGYFQASRFWALLSNISLPKYCHHHCHHHCYFHHPHSHRAGPVNVCLLSVDHHVLNALHMVSPRYCCPSIPGGKCSIQCTLSYGEFDLTSHSQRAEPFCLQNVDLLNPCILNR